MKNLQTNGGRSQPYFARFDMLTTPTIQMQPVAQTVNQGTTAGFGVSAAGSELIYLWLRDGVPLQNGGRISGADTPTLAIADAQPENEGLYSCRVGNGAGAETSQAAQLTVQAPHSGSRIWRPYR